MPHSSVCQTRLGRGFGGGETSSLGPAGVMRDGAFSSCLSCAAATERPCSCKRSWWLSVLVPFGDIVAKDLPHGRQMRSAGGTLQPAGSWEPCLGCTMVPGAGTRGLGSVLSSRVLPSLRLRGPRCTAETSSRSNSPLLVAGTMRKYSKPCSFSFS